MIRPARSSCSKETDTHTYTHTCSHTHTHTHTHTYTCTHTHTNKGETSNPIGIRNQFLFLIFFIIFIIA